MFASIIRSKSRPFLLNIAILNIFSSLLSYAAACEESFEASDSRNNNNVNHQATNESHGGFNNFLFHREKPIKKPSKITPVFEQHRRFSDSLKTCSKISNSSSNFTTITKLDKSATSPFLTSPRKRPQSACSFNRKPRNSNTTFTVPDYTRKGKYLRDMRKREVGLKKRTEHMHLKEPGEIKRSICLNNYCGGRKFKSKLVKKPPTHPHKRSNQNSISNIRSDGSKVEEYQRALHSRPQLKEAEYTIFGDTTKQPQRSQNSSPATSRSASPIVRPLFNQYSITHKITMHQGNNSR